MKNISNTNAHGKENVIQWLKDRFNGSLENTDDKWENFKSLCEAQKKKENDAGDSVNVEEFRLCSLDEYKGDLNIWFSSQYESSISGLSSAFESWEKKNIDLWNLFKSKYPTESPLEKFDDWYSSESDLAGVRQTIDALSKI